MQDSIEKTLELKAPVARVWKALTDHKEFGQWFRVQIDQPFAVGAMSTGKITHPGCEHMVWRVRVEAMDHEKLLSYSWCPLTEGADYDFEAEPKTLVEFELEPTDDGTRLVIRESGFSALPDGQPRLDALRRNGEGWTGQCENITAHVQG